MSEKQTSVQAVSITAATQDRGDAGQRQARRPWKTPAFEEIDYRITQTGGGFISTDGPATYSF
jgi:hypothetical protein